eukprot:CAMPEP_0119070848 /NCGR_PEP_ID=MMETSP1178-20130426/43650_1 /TAXON_ID=33656 /ORGANISM="unid sp, Strain CCMP2000" /LENGTH=115 /DNA_ID=CAMNT_0007052723 /DNA_START=32 /DNA_END=379 /DNA_ORIENTATION=+
MVKSARTILSVMHVYGSRLSVLGPTCRCHAVNSGGEEATKYEAERRFDQRQGCICFGRRAAGRIAVGHSIAQQSEDKADRGKPCPLGQQPIAHKAQVGKAPDLVGLHAGESRAAL